MASAISRSPPNAVQGALAVSEAIAMLKKNRRMDILLRYVMREQRRFGAIHSEPRHLQAGRLEDCRGTDRIQPPIQAGFHSLSLIGSYPLNAAPRTRPA